MNERYQMLAALKGAALKCLIVFCWERRQLTISELVQYVSHDDQTVRKAMLQLQLYGLAAQVLSSQETWHLTSKGYQLPLPLDQLPSPASPGEEKKNFSSTTTSTILTHTSILEQSSSSSSTSGENFSSRPPADDPTVDAAISANLIALHRIGIMGRKATELSRLEWITPDYIQGMHRRWQSEGYTSRDTGLLIKYMSDGDPLPIICQVCDCVGGHHADCPELLPDTERDEYYEAWAERIVSGEENPVKKPAPQLVQAMLRLNTRSMEEFA